MTSKHTSIYLSISNNDDDFINKYLKDKISKDKKHYTKNQIVQDLMKKGIDVESGKYIELEKEMDKFISKLQTIIIEKDGKKFEYTRSKKQVYYWLIEKGLEHMDE